VELFVTSFRLFAGRSQVAVPERLIGMFQRGCWTAVRARRQKKDERQSEGKSGWAQGAGGLPLPFTLQLTRPTVPSARQPNSSRIMVRL
jgi:hypothetical protein